MDKKTQSLIDFLEEKGNEGELRSHQVTPDEKYEVRLSAFRRETAKMRWIIALFSDLYDIEHSEGEVLLKVKNTTS